MLHCYFIKNLLKLNYPKGLNLYLPAKTLLMKNLLAIPLFFLNFLFFTSNCQAQTFTTLHDFTSPADGRNPSGSLVSSGTKLYGMTYRGGIGNNLGTIFSINQDGSGYIILHTFTSASNDGVNPNGSLPISGNVLYGMASGGGASGNGIIFSIKTDGTSFTDLHDFSGSTTDGFNPSGSLILSSGVLYGMAGGGGTYGEGIIFSVNINGSNFQDLYNFSGSTTDGSYPLADLTLSGGVLYGMTPNGGAFGAGTVFSINTDGTSFTNLHDFSGSTTDGSYPQGNLTISGGVLYGVAYNGGLGGYGIIFSMNTDGSSFIDMHDFMRTTTDGLYPGGSLTLSGGVFYGTTGGGGLNSSGIIFSINPNGSSFSDNYDFTNTDGGSLANLVFSGSVAYSMTQNGGVNRDGRIFSFGVAPSCSLTTTANATANVSCNGANNGNATATPASGTAPYTYSWSNGTTNIVSTNNPSGTVLSAGSYTVTVHDANGCNATAVVTITQPNPLTITVTSQTGITCHGGSNGAGTVQGWGGTSPYNYSWNSGPTSTSASKSGLIAGVYTVTITDANGCQAQHTVGLHQPSPMRDSIVSSKTVNVKCNGVNSGFATMGVAYGTAPFTYAWSNGVTVAPAYTLSASTYTVTVSDNCGASGTASVNITQPAALGETVTLNKNVTCYGGNDGAATSNPSGGTTPYSYLWNTGQTTQVVTTGFTAAGHICTLKDNNGCSIAASAVITQPTAITATFVQTKPLCYASADGSITATGHGGSGNYTGYLWSNSQATQTATGISAGTYTVKVTDNNGCSGSSTSTLTSPAVVTPNAITGPVCVTGGGKGTITCSPTGGTRPYSFVWSNSTVSKGNYSPVTVPDGSYTVSITDANNCPTVYASISFSSCPVIRPRNGADQVSPESGLMNINVYPNPSNGQFTIQWSVVSGQWSVEIYNVLGEKVYSQSNIQNSASNINLTSQPNGIYLIRTLDKDGNLVGQKKVVKTN